MTDLCEFPVPIITRALPRFATAALISSAALAAAAAPSSLSDGSTVTCALPMIVEGPREMVGLAINQKLEKNIS